MYIVDSNIIIYSEIPGFEYLRDVFTNGVVYVSEITHLEVLGFHRISVEEELYYKDIFDWLPMISPTTVIFEKAIFLRKTYNMKLGDSIIAATALIFNLTLYTRNLKDFEKIDGLNCINPIK